MSDSMNCRKCGARGDARCVCVPDDATLIAWVLEHDRKATDGPWEAAGPYPKATVYATPRRYDEEPRHVCDVGDFDEFGPALAYDQECIAAYRMAAPELARRLGQRNRELKSARYDHVSDKVLDSQRARYEAVQEEIEAHDKRWGAYVDDAIKDIDQLRKERDEARSKLLALEAAIATMRPATSADGRARDMTTRGYWGERWHDDIHAAYVRNLEKSKP